MGEEEGGGHGEGKWYRGGAWLLPGFSGYSGGGGRGPGDDCCGVKVVLTAVDQVVVMSSS